jgi:hypothetical protein
MKKLLCVLCVGAVLSFGCSDNRAREEERRARAEAESKARNEAEANAARADAARREVQRKSEGK